MSDRFGFGTKEEMRARLAAFKKYNEWEEAHPVRYTPEQALSGIASLYRFLPAQHRTRNDDPTYEGIRKMMRAFAQLGRERS